MCVYHLSSFNSTWGDFVSFFLTFLPEDRQQLRRCGGDAIGHTFQPPYTHGTRCAHRRHHNIQLSLYSHTDSLCAPYRYSTHTHTGSSRSFALYACYQQLAAIGDGSDTCESVAARAMLAPAPSTPPRPMAELESCVEALCLTWALPGYTW